MKLVVNRCFGGFGLSPRAVKRIAELEGKPCFFFINDITKGLNHKKAISLDDLEAHLKEHRISMWSAYSVEEPDFERMSRPDRDGLYKKANEYAASVSIESRYDRDKRNDPTLVRVVEELGDEASGTFAELEVVEIPDGTEWYVDEYDGGETVREGRTW